MQANRALTKCKKHFFLIHVAVSSLLQNYNFFSYNKQYCTFMKSIDDIPKQLWHKGSVSYNVRWYQKWKQSNCSQRLKIWFPWEPIRNNKKWNSLIYRVISRKHYAVFTKMSSIAVAKKKQKKTYQKVLLHKLDTIRSTQFFQLRIVSSTLLSVCW